MANSLLGILLLAITSCRTSYVVFRPATVNADFNKPVSLKCSSDEAIDIYFKGLRIVQNSRYALSRRAGIDLEMTIQRVEIRDIGTYTCRSSASSPSAPGTVLLQLKPYFPDNSKVFNKQLATRSIINFTIISAPRPDVKYQKRQSDGSYVTIAELTDFGIMVIGLPAYYISRTTGHLTIFNVKSTDEGEYNVTTTFSGATSRGRFTLNVYSLPNNTILSIDPQYPKLNQIIRLSCTANGKPVVSQYRFFLNDTFIGNSTNGSLAINASDCLQYSGYYKCIPVNAGGEGAENKQLVITTDDAKTSTATTSSTFNETDNATLLCEVSGCPLPYVSWSKNGILLYKYGKSLTLPFLSKADAGRYSCHAHNAYTNSSSEIKVTVNYKPIGTQFSSTTTKPLVNTTIVLNCTSHAVPVSKYRFVRVDGSGKSEVNSYNSEKTGVFFQSSIMHSTTAYNVSYKCIPYNLLGNGFERTLTVDVQVPAKIVQFTVIPHIVNEFGSVSFECKSSGNPPPNITITDPNNVTVPYNMGRVRLGNVSRNRAGLYTCRASNGILSQIIATTELLVNYAPEVLSLRAIPSQVHTGSHSMITCIATGLPTPQFRFYDQNGTLLQDGAAASYQAVLRYEIFPSYRATYMCIPYNKKGEGVRQYVTVEILVPAKIVQFTVIPHIVNEFGSVSFECKSSGNPPPNITITDPNNVTVPYNMGQVKLGNVSRNRAGLYTCRASNGILSQAIATTELVVNYGPRFLSKSTEYERCIDEKASVVCTAVGNPLPEVLLYKNGILLKRNVTNVRHQLTINSASDFGAYICISNNSVGRVSVTTIINEKPSGTVNNISLSANDNSIKVTWDLPQCKGNIKEIKVQYRKKGESNWGVRSIVAATSVKEATIKGLDKGFAYEVRVVVVDIGGREHMAKALGTAKIGLEPAATGSSINIYEIAFYALISLFVIIVALLLLWIVKLKKKANEADEERNTHLHDSEPYARTYPIIS